MNSSLPGMLGDVILFCGAGFSQQSAKLPNFHVLADRVIHGLGAAQDSRARALLRRASEFKPMPDIGGVVATDRPYRKSHPESGPR
jgi:hypothetical protein